MNEKEKAECVALIEAIQGLLSTLEANENAVVKRITQLLEVAVRLTELYIKL